MINKYYESLEEMAFDYASSELEENGKEITVYEVMDNVKSKVIERIKGDVDFELNDNDIAEISTGVEEAIADYLFS